MVGEIICKIGFLRLFSILLVNHYQLHLYFVFAIFLFRRSLTFRSLRAAVFDWGGVNNGCIC